MRIRQSVAEFYEDGGGDGFARQAELTPRVVLRSHLVHERVISSQHQESSARPLLLGQPFLFTIAETEVDMRL